MANFTPITDAADLFQYVTDSILWQTYYEAERIAWGLPIRFPIPLSTIVIGDTDMQAVDWWEPMQNRYEVAADTSRLPSVHATTWAKPIDHSLHPGVGGWAGLTAPLPEYTTAAWATNSGLSAGYRRATEWEPPTSPVFQNGHIQSGDILNYWQFQDLQKGASGFVDYQQPSGVVLANYVLRLVAVTDSGGARFFAPWSSDAYGVRASDGLLEYENTVYKATNTGAVSITTDKPFGYYSASLFVHTPVRSWTWPPA